MYLLVDHVTSFSNLFEVKGVIIVQRREQSQQ